MSNVLVYTKLLYQPVKESEDSSSQKDPIYQKGFKQLSIFRAITHLFHLS